MPHVCIEFALNRHRPPAPHGARSTVFLFASSRWPRGTGSPIFYLSGPVPFPLIPIQTSCTSFALVTSNYRISHSFRWPSSRCVHWKVHCPHRSLAVIRAHFISTGSGCEARTNRVSKRLCNTLTADLPLGDLPLSSHYCV